MKNTLTIFFAIISALLMSACTSTFGGTVFVVGFRDVILYVVIALIVAGLISFIHSDKRRNIFLVWFVVSLVITPLPGLIYFLYKATKKKDR